MSLANDFQFPGESPRRKGILDTSRKGLLRTHARALAMGQREGGGARRGARPRSALSERDCSLPGVLALVNRVYAAVHGLRRGPFARGDQVVEWFDEDGDGKVSASEFAVKMRVRIPSDWRGGSSSAARVRRDNDFRVEARLSQTRRVIEVARDGLMRALEGRANTKRGRSTGTIVLSEVAKALKVFVDTFSHLGHQRLINHRFLEVSECISRFPASALVTRAGVRALDMLRAQIEEDAATLICRWYKRGGISSEKRNGADFWSQTLRRMTERERLRAKARARKDMQTRQREREDREKRRATEQVQAFFRSKLALRGSKNSSPEEAVTERERALERREGEGDAGDIVTRPESLFDAHRRKMREAKHLRMQEVAERRKRDIKRFMEDPFVHGFLGYRQSQAPVLADFWNGPSGKVPSVDLRESGTRGGDTQKENRGAAESKDTLSQTSKAVGKSRRPQRPWTSQGRRSTLRSTACALNTSSTRGPNANQISRPARPATAAASSRSRGGGLKSRKKKQLQVYSRPMSSVKRQRIMRESRLKKTESRGCDTGLSMVYVSNRLNATNKAILRMPPPHVNMPPAENNATVRGTRKTRELRLLPNGFESLGK